MTDIKADPRAIVRPLLRTRQYREFTDEPVAPAVLDAIVDAARWSGSSQNSQPWRFIVVRDASVLREIAEAGLPMTRAVGSASAAVGIAMPDDKSRAVSHAYDEGRAAERMLVAASMLGVGAGISWLRPDVREVAARILGVPSTHFIRTLVAIGHPTESARAPKSAAGNARKPRDEIVFDGTWQADATDDA
jgi:nitroreductase